MIDRFNPPSFYDVPTTNFDWFFFSKMVGRCSNDVQQCPMKFLWRFENIPIITNDIRRRLRCSPTVDWHGPGVMHCCMKIYYHFFKNYCVVFILIVLHLIYLVFKKFWINIIIETSRKIKIKAGEKTSIIICCRNVVEWRWIDTVDHSSLNYLCDDEKVKFCLLVW